MSSLAVDFLIKAKGPLGGDLNNPRNNPQFRNAPFQGEVKENGTLGLHDPREQDTTRHGIQKEQPWHRMAAFMLLAGRTNSEIAMAASVTAIAVSTLRGQRWFQELLATLANETGADITGLLASEAQNSLNTIVDIRDDLELPARVRLAAAQTLLEQSHGKPTQKIISAVSHTTFASPSEEMESVQQQLAALRSSATQKELPAPTQPEA